jgi:glycosyltransferase involved in cell wall biosynthesis
VKILLIAPAVFTVPLTGYGGTEQVCYSLAEEYAMAGHDVTLVAAAGSTPPPGVTLLPVPLQSTEEAAYAVYQDHLADYDIIHDHTYQSWCYLRSIGYDPPLPIVKTCHTSPDVWLRPPPVPHPCLVGISLHHSQQLSLRYEVPVRSVYNGIDTSVYHPPEDPEAPRSGRYLWVGRYTPEKDPITAMQLAKRLRIPLDCFGDTSVVSSQDYVERCRREADELLVRWNPAVSREETVTLFQTYKALIYTPAWNEPFGLVMAEAMACGMPVLTIDRGSTPEVVKHRVGGYVGRNINKLEEFIRVGGVSSLKTEDCARIGSGFTKQHMAQAYTELFEQVLAGNLW